MLGKENKISARKEAKFVKCLEHFLNFKLNSEFSTQINQVYFGFTMKGTEVREIELL